MTCLAQAQAKVGPVAGQTVWNLLGVGLPALTSQVLEVTDTPHGQRWTVLLNGSQVTWVQRAVVATDATLVCEQVTGDLAELETRWTLAGEDLHLAIRFGLGIDGLAPLLDPIWTQAFQAFADDLVRSVAAAIARTVSA